MQSLLYTDENIITSSQAINLLFINTQHRRPFLELERKRLTKYGTIIKKLYMNFYSEFPRTDVIKEKLRFTFITLNMVNYCFKVTLGLSPISTNNYTVIKSLVDVCVGIKILCSYCA